MFNSYVKLPEGTKCVQIRIAKFDSFRTDGTLCSTEPTPCLIILGYFRHTEQVSFFKSSNPSTRNLTKWDNSALQTHPNRINFIIQIIHMSRFQDPAWFARESLSSMILMKNVVDFPSSVPSFKLGRSKKQIS